MKEQDIPDQSKNDRETGARKLDARPGVHRPDPVHTGDKGDEPKKPYGLTESADDRGTATRHYDGKNSGKQQ